MGVAIGVGDAAQDIRKLAARQMGIAYSSYCHDR